MTNLSNSYYWILRIWKLENSYSFKIFNSASTFLFLKNIFSFKQKNWAWTFPNQLSEFRVLSILNKFLDLIAVKYLIVVLNYFKNLSNAWITLVILACLKFSHLQKKFWSFDRFSCIILKPNSQLWFETASFIIIFQSWNIRYINKELANGVIH